MRHHDVRLRERLVSPADAPLVHAEHVRIARRLRAAGLARIGLLPAGADVAVPSLALGVGAALHELSGELVVVVDANVRWPAFAGSPRAEPAARAPRGAPSEASTPVFSARAVTAGVKLLAPRRPLRAATGLGPLRALCDEWAPRCAHLMLDLTGFDVLGELPEAVGLVDGVLLVASVGRTRDDELLRLDAALPESHRLGVVLLG